MKKLVAVLGGGHGAHAMAVDLSSRGFSVNMYEMPRSSTTCKRSSLPGPSRHREKFAVNSKSTT